MNTTIYIESFPLTSSEQELTDLFSRYGKVANVLLVPDRTNSEPSAFGFVTMATHKGAKAAVQALHGKVNGSTAFSIRERAWGIVSRSMPAP